MKWRNINFFVDFFLFCKETPNELRIDAAGVEKVKRNGEGAAASVLVELSRIWKKKPGGTVKKSQKEVHPTNKERSGKYFT
jgi:hypothetical protein